MPVVASVNYATRRIYLSADTVGVPLDTLDVYREVRALRRTTEAHRAYRPMIVGGGGIQKTATTFTQQYVQLLNGCHIVPYDAPQSLVLVRDTFADDDRAGVECFDRAGLSSLVDIDVQVSPVEVREVATGAADPSTIVTAMMAALNAARIPVNVKQVNDVALAGAGVPGNSMRPAT